ncbi:MAG: hypothetical protein OCD00_03120 [Colwellia sp.]
MAITLRPSDEQLEQIEVLKKSFNTSTSSKALFGAASLYPILKKDLWDAERKVESLERELEHLKRSITYYESSREQMLELANR